MSRWVMPYIPSPGDVVRITQISEHNQAVPFCVGDMLRVLPLVELYLAPMEVWRTDTERWLALSFELWPISTFIVRAEPVNCDACESILAGELRGWPRKRALCAYCAAGSRPSTGRASAVPGEGNVRRFEGGFAWTGSISTPATQRRGVGTAGCPSSGQAAEAGPGVCFMCGAKAPGLPFTCSSVCTEALKLHQEMLSIGGSVDCPETRAESVRRALAQRRPHTAPSDQTSKVRDTIPVPPPQSSDPWDWEVWSNPSADGP